MNYLSVEKVTKTWHDKPILKEISFGIQQGQKIALVAGNGQGKSTLLSIITGLEAPDSGISVIRKGIRWAILPQEPELDAQLSILDNILFEKNEITDLVKKYEEELEKEDPDLGAIDSLNEMMSELDAWDYEAKVKQVLGKLDIHQTDRLVGVLSGGQKKRVALAKVLLSQPDFLILDEPTNHLDLEMIEWLEGFLAQKDLTLLLVTHDRYFLDRVCQSIIEIDNGELHQYQGNFSYYMEKKAEREAQIASELEKDRNLYRRELEWVRRMPKARGTKSKSRIDSFDKLSEKLKSTKKKLELNFSLRTERMGSKILEMHHVKKSFGVLSILDDFNYVFRNKEKVGIIGPNGVGKTTFLNMVMDLDNVDSGKIIRGETVKFGYYTQHAFKVESSKKVIDVIREVADWIPMANSHKLTASQLLLNFGFDYSKQYDYVSKLSGGELRRLHLCRILMDAPNFLILDEPTNDLDIQTLSVLENFIEGYEGCVLIVSHDRYFMDRIVDHCLVFEGEGIVRDFPGNYSEYRETKEIEDEEIQQTKKNNEKSAESNVKPESDFVKPRKMTFKEKFELDQITEELETLQIEKETLETELSGLTTEFEEISKISERLKIISDKIDKLEFRWLELSELGG